MATSITMPRGSTYTLDDLKRSVERWRQPDVGLDDPRVIKALGLMPEDFVKQVLPDYTRPSATGALSTLTDTSSNAVTGLSGAQNPAAGGALPGITGSSTSGASTSTSSTGGVLPTSDVDLTLINQAKDLSYTGDNSYLFANANEATKAEAANLGLYSEVRSPKQVLDSIGINQ